MPNHSHSRRDSHGTNKLSGGHEPTTPSRAVRGTRCCTFCIRLVFFIYKKAKGAMTHEPMPRRFASGRPAALRRECPCNCKPWALGRPIFSEKNRNVVVRAESGRWGKTELRMAYSSSRDHMHLPDRIFQIQRGVEQDSGIWICLFVFLKRASGSDQFTHSRLKRAGQPTS